MLRAFVITMAVLAILGGGLMLWAGAGAGGAVPAIFGLLVLIGTLFERRYYRNETRPPTGPGWAQTGETFKDPAKGGRVEVWYNAANGERRYVRRGGD